jgi:hypothetical protein
MLAVVGMLAMNQHMVTIDEQEEGLSVRVLADARTGDCDLGGHG